MKAKYAFKKILAYLNAISRICITFFCMRGKCCIRILNETKNQGLALGYFYAKFKVKM